MFRAIFSIILWPIGSIIFLIGAIVYSVSIVFFSPNRLHPLAQVISRIIMLFGGQWFRVKGIAPDPKKGPYLYMMNHESLFDAFILASVTYRFIVGVGAEYQLSLIHI